MTLWKQIMLEDMHLPSDEYQIYCDMDGVLVDFASGAVRLVNARIKHFAKNIEAYSTLKPDNKNPEYREYKLVKKIIDRVGSWDAELTWGQIDGGSPSVIKPARDLMFFWAARDKDWWATLGWAPGGKQLWNFIKKYDPIILTSGVGPKSAEGKYEWCQRELGLSQDRVIVVSNKGIDTGNKTGILIDDRLKPLGQFKGVGIHYKTGSPGPAIEELKQYGFS